LLSIKFLFCFVLFMLLQVGFCKNFVVTTIHLCFVMLKRWFYKVFGWLFSSTPWGVEPQLGLGTLECGEEVSNMSKPTVLEHPLFHYSHGTPSHAMATHCKAMGPRILSVPRIIMPWPNQHLYWY
jgi:hypothetical protein